MTDQVLPTAEQERDLKIARNLIDAGIAIFAAPPCKGPHCKIDGHSGKIGQYDFPKNWQLTIPAVSNLERWRPGYALAMVGGRVADVLDADTYNGGDISLQELRSAGHMPRVFGEATSASGGSHFIISATGEPECNGFMPGLDLQSGTKQPNSQGGHSRAFAWIAPTVRPSKVTGELTPYRWVREPDTDALLEWVRADGECTDESTQGLIDRVRAYRATKNKPRQAVTEADDDPFASPSRAFDQLFDSARGGGDGRRDFTLEQAQDFVRPFLLALRTAQINGIETAGMDATLAMEHFVPVFWSAQEAFAHIERELQHTAYDGKTWTKDKFLARLDGRRPVLGSWKAEVRTASELGGLDAGPDGLDRAGPVQPTVDAVDALIAEMLTDEQLISRPPPKPLILGVLDLDSEAWIIGKPGSRKTFVALSMAGAVATGTPWQGRRTHQAPVIMIVAEGAGGISLRVKAHRERYGPMGDFRVLPRPVQAGAGASRDSLGAPWLTLVEACRRLQPGLIIIDTQARVTVGLKENVADEMGIYILAVSALREATGACVLTIHHSGRQGDDARGSSAIDGAQGTELRVTAEGKKSELRGALFMDKQKDMAETEDGIPLAFSLVPLGTDPETGRDLSSLVLAPEPGEFDHLVGQVRAPERVYVPTFDERDVWRRRILDVLYVYAPAGRGMTKPEVVGVMVRDFDLDKTSGSWKAAWKDVLEMTDPDGEPIVSSPTGSRYEIGSLLTRAGLEKELKGT